MQLRIAPQLERRLLPTLSRWIPQTSAVRRAQLRVREWLGCSAALQLLPPLIGLPLWPEGAAGAVLDPLLASGASVSLHGTPGSGRSLALLQLAWHRATTAPQVPSFYVSLAHADVLNLPPRTVLTGLLNAAPRAARGRQRLLLLDDWEQLPASRRDAWCDFISSLADSVPALQVVVVLPLEEPVWPGLHAVTLPRCTRAAALGWWERLAPQVDSAVLSMLADDPARAALAERLADVALLALTYPYHGLPLSRSDLYAQALPLVAPLAPPEAPDAPAPAADRTSPRPGLALLSAYRRAQTIAADGDLTPFLELEGAERAEVARLLAHLLADPAPVYATLWGPVQPARADLLTLGKCLRERPQSAPAWGWRIVAALAQLDSSAHQQLACDLLPLLPPIVAAAGPTLAPAHAADLATALAPLLSAHDLQTLIDMPALAPVVRWALADQVLAGAAGAAACALLVATAAPDDTATAIRACVFAGASAATRAQLAVDPAAAWLPALHSPAVTRERRRRAALSLIGDTAAPVVVRSAGLALLELPLDPAVLDDLLIAAVDHDPAVQSAARALVTACPLQAVLQRLSALLFASSQAPVVRLHLLELVAGYPQSEAAVLLARAALNGRLPLAGRFRAIDLLAARPTVGVRLLRRVLVTPAVDPLIRAAALRRLVAHDDDPPIDYLALLAERDEPLVLRRAAIQALATIAGRPALRNRAVSALQNVSTAVTADATLTLTLIEALRAVPAPAAAPLLAGLLNRADLAERFSAGWLARAPQLAGMALADWSARELAAQVRVALFEQLTTDDCLIDPPVDLAALVARQAAAVQTAAAATLTALVERLNDPILRAAVVTLLRRAVRTAGMSGPVRGFLDCLARVEADGGLASLQEFLADPASTPALRWLALEHLATHQHALPLLLRWLEQPALDELTRCKIIQLLGDRADPTALPVLQPIASGAAPLAVRTQAVGALGRFAAPQAEETLLPLVVDTAVTPEVRATAAAALPAPLSGAARQALHDVLRHEFAHSALIGALLQALGRAGDRESLVLMLRYVQSETPQLACAAIAAVSMLGDISVTPILVRVAQDSAVDRTVRLHAVGALLRLAGAEYLPLLRDYLHSGSPALQLAALEYLLALPDAYQYLSVLLTDRALTPVAQLRAIDAVAGHEQVVSLLQTLLADPAADVNVLCRAATLLTTHADPDLVPLLAQAVAAPGSSPQLQRCCIVALARQSAAAPHVALPARLALSDLADSPGLAPEVCAAAAAALAASPG